MKNESYFVFRTHEPCVPTVEYVNCRWTVGCGGREPCVPTPECDAAFDTLSRHTNLVNLIIFAFIFGQICLSTENQNPT